MPGTEPRQPVTLAELTAGLVWPRLFRVFPLAVQPPRVLLGLLVVLWTLIVGAGYDALTGARLQPVGFADAVGPFQFVTERFRDGAHAATLGALRLDAARVFDGVREMLVTGPRGVWLQAPGHAVGLTITLLLLVLPPVTLLAGAICRMVACDVASEMSLSVAAAVSTAGSRWRSLLGAVAGPMIVAGSLALFIAALGAGLLRFPGVMAVGGVFYGVLLLLGAALVFVVVGYAVGGWMLIPAVVVEGTDAIDAAQRAYAYTLGRPGRTLAYAALLLALLVIAYGVLSLLTAEAIQWTAGLASAWTGAPPIGGEVHAFAAHSPHSSAGLTGSARFAAAAVRWWESFALNLLSGFVVSFVCAGSTLLYLLLRRVNDDQDIEDIWSPEARASVSLPAPER